MNLLDSIGMAFRNLVRQKARTILTIIAITVGSLSLILMASTIIGVRQSLVDQFKQFGAFNLVTVIKDPNSVNNNSLLSSNGDPSSGKKIDDTTLTQMRQLPHVVQATATINNFGINTMSVEGESKKTWASLMAYDPANDVFSTPIAFGRKLAPGDLDKAVVGNRFISDMGYSGHPQDLVGKRIILNYQSGPGSAPDWGALPIQPPPNANRDWYDAQTNNTIQIPAEIVGVTSSSAIDDGQSYVTLDWAKRLITSVSWQQSPCGPNQPCTNSMTLVKNDNLAHQGYSSIIVKADDTTNLDTIVGEIKNLGYGANTAQKMLDQINHILLIMSIVLAGIGGISLFVATIGIVNTMIMATYERTREIGVLRACGATRATIRRLFSIEAALLGFWGGVFGLLFSLILGQVAGLIARNYSSSLNGLPVSNLGHFPLWLIGVVIVFTTILGMLSGLFPAIRAARLNPVEALRYE